MIDLDPNQVHGLEWRQPGAFARSFELRRGDALLGTLKFTKTFGSLAEGRTSRAAWSFKRNGFFSTNATARVLGTEQDIAVYQPNWTGSKGMVTLAGGERLILKNTSFWGGDWGWYTESDNPLVLFKSRGVFHHGSDISVEEPARRRPDLPLLLLFGWYVLVLHQEDSAATAVVISG